MDDLKEILTRLAAKGLISFSADGQSVKLTPEGKEKIETELYGELVEDEICEIGCTES